MNGGIRMLSDALFFFAELTMSIFEDIGGAVSAL